MKRIFLLAFIGIFILSLASTYGYSQSAKDILGKMIDAQGGKKALEGVKDSKTTGTIELPQMGMNGNIKTYWKAPNKSRQDFEMMGMTFTNIFDGEKGWAITPQTGGPQQLPEKMAGQLKRAAYGNNVLLNPGKYGIKYAFKGKGKAKDTDCFIIEQTHADGHKSTMYVDAKTYLPVKTDSRSFNAQGQEVDIEIVYSDYKKVGGIMAAHTVIQNQGGQLYMKMKINEMAYNGGLEDSLFKVEVKEEAKK
jgi:outer membrane lipoprotein-sorting protein